MEINLKNQMWWRSYTCHVENRPYIRITLLHYKSRIFNFNVYVSHMRICTHFVGRINCCWGGGLCGIKSQILGVVPEIESTPFKEIIWIPKYQIHLQFIRYTGNWFFSTLHTFMYRIVGGMLLILCFINKRVDVNFCCSSAQSKKMLQGRFWKSISDVVFDMFH